MDSWGCPSDPSGSPSTPRASVGPREARHSFGDAKKDKNAGRGYSRRFALTRVSALLVADSTSSPSRTRTYNKPVTSPPKFPWGMDYLITLVGCGALVAGLLVGLLTS